MTEAPRPSATPVRLALVVGLGWVLTLTAMQWSVVRFRVLIVVVLTCAAVALWTWLGRGARPVLEPWTVLVVGVGTALATVVVPVFTYVPDPHRAWILGLHAVAAVTVTTLLLSSALSRRLRGPRPAAVAVLLVAAFHAAIAALTIVFSPAPRIDVWVVLQQAADAIGRGENIYGRSWVGSPGVDDAFTYLPWTALLLAPGRWVAGDIRWSLLVWSLLGAVGLWLLCERRAWPAAAGGLLILLSPGIVTQVDQAWTEPLLLTLVIWWAVLVRRGHPWWAVIPLAFAVASKQHIALILPVLLMWRGFGPARAVTTAALGGLLVTPWLVADAGAFVHDTVLLLIDFHPIRFSNTLYLLAVNVVGVTPPFWLTGLVVLAAIVAAGLVVRRPGTGLAVVLRASAVVLLTANLVNKQAFYNQFWLVAGLVAVSMVMETAARPPPDGPEPAPTRGRATPTTDRVA
ncbi:DUF2029 domain-containing protein [Nostocoides sp. F2B08]|uniref:DUF2029 domain-containing protein n=1 Tax=Nostocoides sp. F2B08 TaxID=2653936 RepID=UPI00186B2A39|nr:DUF2029 domain-containing protein [Tetrasphaera sp. F2B08]